MEFPELGKQCALRSCRQLDFLPYSCDACKQIFCHDHVSYESHGCSESYKKDRRVPVCPLCNEPVSIGKDTSPDQAVNQHIENDCKSDLARGRQKTYTNRCNMKGCKQRELVPVTCASCRRNYCLRHRHENDHNCTHRNPLQNNHRIPPVNLPKRTINQMSRPENSTTTRMSEDEALAKAIEASLRDTKTPSAPSEAHTKPQSQEEEDLQLARALAESEREERNRQRRQNQQQAQASQHDSGSGCNIA